MRTTTGDATRTLCVPIYLEVSPVHVILITKATDSSANVSDLRSVFNTLGFLPKLFCNPTFPGSSTIDFNIVLYTVFILVRLWPMWTNPRGFSSTLCLDLTYLKAVTKGRRSGHSRKDVKKSVITNNSHSER